MTFNLQLEGLLLLLLFVAPGFLFLRTFSHTRGAPYSQYHYRQEQTLVDQIVLCVIASVIIHVTISFFFFVPVMFYIWRFKRSAPLRNLFPPLSSYLAAHFVILVAFFTVYVVLTLVFAWMGGRFFGKRFPLPEPLWLKLLISEPVATGSVPIRLTVRLRNGEEHTGYLSSLVWLGDKENTFELVLDRVIYSPADSGESAVVDKAKRRKATIELPNQRVLFRSQDILWLSRLEVPEEGAVA